MTQILESKKGKTSDKDIVEVRNYSDALEYVEVLAEEKAKLRIVSMCDIQKLITKDLLADRNQWGNVRTVKVEIADANSGKKIDDVPELQIKIGPLKFCSFVLCDHLLVAETAAPSYELYDSQMRLVTKQANAWKSRLFLT